MPKPFHRVPDAAVVCGVVGCVPQRGRCRLPAVQVDRRTQCGEPGGGDLLFGDLGYDDEWGSSVQSFADGTHSGVGDGHGRAVENSELRYVWTDPEGATAFGGRARAAQHHLPAIVCECGFAQRCEGGPVREQRAHADVHEGLLVVQLQVVQLQVVEVGSAGRSAAGQGGPDERVPVAVGRRGGVQHPG